MRGAIAIGLLASTIIAAPTASARPASKGWFAEGGIGATVFLPPTAQYADPGPNLEVRVGRDLVSWFSLAVFASASSHAANVPPPPKGEWFQLYRGGADARLGGLVGRVALFVEGGAGVAALSSNVLDKVGVTAPGDTFALAVHAGVGLGYQLENRHYELGAAADGFVIPNFDAARGVGLRAYLRYTY